MDNDIKCGFAQISGWAPQPQPEPPPARPIGGQQLAREP